MRQNFMSLFIVILFINMKKLHSYLLKPEQLRKKLQNPRFRQDFIQNNKNNISFNRDQSFLHNYKSQVESIQRQLQFSHKRPSSNNKENHKVQPNVRPNSAPKDHQQMILKSKKFNNQPDLVVKRNTSNSILRPTVQSNYNNTKRNGLGQKNRYNSCSAIDYQNGQHCSSKFKTAQQQPKCLIRQRYSYRTRQGVQANNPHKVNQDSLVIKTNFAERGINLYAVADGHGTFGHMASQYLVKNISKLYEEQSNTCPLSDSIPKVFERLQRGLTQSDINVSCSGSTLVNVLIEGDQVICANVGDSRAILARQIDRKDWELIYLSQDHKPSVESEKRRILKNGGRIHALKDQNGLPLGPLRVWLPNQNLQGLAMSRSFGDNVSKVVGVISEPQVIRMKLDKRDKFILLASDGVWQFITNQEILQLLVPYYKENKLEEACEALSKLAYSRWTKYDTSVVDDTTFILIFLSE